jgi:hypothetical protein
MNNKKTNPLKKLTKEFQRLIAKRNSDLSSEIIVGNRSDDLPFVLNEIGSKFINH